MSEAQSSVALRILIRSILIGGGDALDNIITNELPNGAQCFVTSAGALFRFRKFSTAAASPGLVVVPIAGGGRWLREGLASGTATAFVSASALNSIDSGADTNWNQPQTAFFSLQASGSVWSLTALGCILTYSGPATAAIGRLVASVQYPVSASASGGISQDDDLTSTTLGFGTGAQPTDLYDNETVGVHNAVITVERYLALAPGTTVRPKFRVDVGGNDLVINNLSLSIVPA